MMDQGAAIHFFLLSPEPTELTELAPAWKIQSLSQPVPHWMPSSHPALGSLFTIFPIERDGGFHAWVGEGTGPRLTQDSQHSCLPVCSQRLGHEAPGPGHHPCGVSRAHTALGSTHMYISHTCTHIDMQGSCPQATRLKGLMSLHCPPFRAPHYSYLKARSFCVMVQGRQRMLATRSFCSWRFWKILSGSLLSSASTLVPL